MKLYCTQENLNRGLNIVGHLAGKNATLPILDNVLIKTENGVIELSATNLEMGVSCRVRGKIEREGKITVPAKLFSDYISLLPNEKLSIEEIEKKIYLRCTNQETIIQGMSAEDYPLIPTLEKKNKVQINCEKLKKAIKETVFAAAYDETRPEISGVLLRVDDKNVKLVATDSYRLAEAKIELENKNQKEFETILPSRTIQELIRILGLVSVSQLEIYFSENQTLFNFDDVEIISRAIEGRYPDYQQIIPKEYKTKVISDKEELIKTIKTTSLFSRMGINDINLKISPAKKELVISAVNAQLGENISRLKVEAEGEENEIVFNHRYLLEGLLNTASEKVVMEIINNTNPGMIKPEGQDDYLYIVMPIKQ